MKIQVSLKSLKLLLPFCSVKEHWFVLNGVRIIDKQVDDKFYRIYEATDGRILARIMKQIDIIELSKDIILFADDIKKIDKKLKIDMIDCEIFKNKDGIDYRAVINNTIISLIDGVYPNTEKAIMPFCITYPEKWIKNDKFFYVRGKYITQIEEFFHGGKLKVNGNWNDINGVMDKQYIKKGSVMLSYTSQDIDEIKLVVVMPVIIQ